MVRVIGQRFAAHTDAAILVMLTCLVSAAGCATGGPRLLTPRIPFAQTPGMELPETCAVIFFIDGASPAVISNMVRRGELPNIDRTFVRGGVRVDHAVTSLPTVTYPNAVSLITGMFPGHHGVLGNRWFDRHTLTTRDYGSPRTYRSVNQDFHAPTIFEILEDRFTISVQAHTRRGAQAVIDHTLRGALDWWCGRYSRVDRRVGRSIHDVIRAARRARRWPMLTMHYFPGVDEIAHRRGPESQAYRDALRVVDDAIGRIIRGIEREGMANRTFFVLVSDHGHVASPMSHRIDLASDMTALLGVSATHNPRPQDRFERSPAKLDRFDAVVINGAYRRIAIHLRGKNGWHERPDAAVIKRIIEGNSHPEPRALARAETAAPIGTSAHQGLPALQSVGLVCVRDDHNRIHVHSRSAEAIVERRVVDGHKQYRILDQPRGENSATLSAILGYRSNETLATFVDQGWHDSRDWLRATCSTRCPDFVPQIVEMFDSDRAGDIVVFAKDNWSFNPRQPGGHGCCLAADMHIPLYFAGPGLPAGSSAATARLVDVMPTVLDLIGESDRLKSTHKLDGVSLLPKLMAPSPRHHNADQKN